MNTHPVYKAAKARAEATGRTPSIDTADVAKLIRTRLKSVFPATKFSVRIDRYAGGSSVRVSWQDGPTEKLVSAITSPYEGKGFDGMIDMAYYKNSFLNPDGSAAFGDTSGTEGSGGVYAEQKHWKPSANAIRVSMGGCYVFTSRGYSGAFLHRVLDRYAEKYNDKISAAIKSGAIYVKEDGEHHFIDGASSVASDCGRWGDQILFMFRSRRMVAA